MEKTERWFRHDAALDAKAPVVRLPFAFELLPKSTLAPRPGRVDVFICPPIDTSECRDLQRLVEAARSAIAAKLAASSQCEPLD